MMLKKVCDENEKRKITATSEKIMWWNEAYAVHLQYQYYYGFYCITANFVA